MRVAIYQGPEQPGTVAAALHAMMTAAASAASAGARLLICPEMFLTGYNIGADAARELAEPVDGPSAQRVAAIARETGLAILYGYPERAGDSAYNAAQLLDRDGGRLANARKCHLFSELDRGMFKAGDALARAELDGVRIGLLICYDVEFPEAVRTHALAGADLVAVPTALMRPYEMITRTLVPTRAMENQLFVAYANRCGREGDLVYTGESCVVGPDGVDIARAGQGEELIVADLDVDAAAALRRSQCYLSDRRPELYDGRLSSGNKSACGRTTWKQDHA